MSSETALYRHFCDAGELLYVGISNSVAGRLAQHARYSGWAKRIARVDVEYYEDRGKAEKAEIEAIRKEKPLWNILHNAPESKKKPGARVIHACTKKTASVAQEVGLAAQELRNFHDLMRYRLIGTDDNSRLSIRFYFTAPLPALTLKELSDFMGRCGIRSLGFAVVTGVAAGNSDDGHGFLTLSTPFALRDYCSEIKDVQDDDERLALALDEYEQAFQSLISTCT